MRPEAEPLQRALIDAIRRPSAAQTISVDIGSYLRAQGVDECDVQANSNRTSVERFLLYRSLIQNRIRSAIEVSLPSTIARLGQELLVEVLDGFLQQRASRSHYLRDVASEFVDYCEQTAVLEGRTPAYLIELARHELLLFEVPAAEDDPPLRAEPEIELDACVRFQNATRLMRYAHAVHRVAGDGTEQTPPVAGDFRVLAYRDSNREIRCLELSAVAAAVVQRLFYGETLREAILGGCSDEGACADDAMLGELAAFLTELAERGILLS